MIHDLIHHIPGEGPVQHWVNGHGIHGPQIAYWLGVAFAAACIVAALAMVTLAVTGHGERVRRPGWRRRIALATGAVLAVCVSGLSYTAAQAGSPDPEVHPVSIPTMSTPAPFRSVQVADQVCLTNPTEQIALPRTIGEGDYLLLVFAGQGYRGAPAAVTSVSDELNGNWTRLYDRQTISGGGRQYLDFAAFRLEHSRAGHDVISVAGTWGQAGGTVTILDISGAEGQDAASFAGGVGSDGAGRVLSPAATATAGDLVLGVFGAYNYGQSIGAAPGWTMDVSAGSYTCSATVIEHLTRSAGSGRQEAPLVTGSANFFGFGAGVVTLRPDHSGDD
ncbi:MAG TPA: hypothetical protein VIA06_17850 [Candidatus Dormibacteraeota bacterium]|nr:hypothetical protein [Candidatus Dormibacteraeota bacterium]